MFSTEATESIRQHVRKLWGEQQFGYCYTVRPGIDEWNLFMPQVGRRFINGREVHMYVDRSELGDEYFLPPGNYAGRVLS